MEGAKRFLSLKWKIMIATLIPLVLCCVLISAITLPPMMTALYDTAQTRFLQVGQKYAGSFEEKISGAMNYLSILASELEMRVNTGEVDREALQRTVYRIFDDYQILDGSSVYFESDAFDGRDAEYRGTEYGTPKSGRICWYFYRDKGVTAYMPEGIGDDIEFDMPHYANAKAANVPIYTDPASHEIDGELIHMFTLTYPVRDSAEAFIGAVTVDLFLDDLYAQLQNEAIYITGYTMIVSDNGRVIYSPRYDDIGKTQAEAGIESPPNGLGAPSFFHGHSILNGKESLTAVEPLYIAQLDRYFSIMVVAPLDEINSDGTRVLAILIAVLIMSMLGIALLLYYLVGRFSAPLLEITRSVDKIAGGAYNTRITGAYKGEFAVVKDSVNTMADSIENNLKALDQRLGQQSLMASISQSFLADDDIDSVITHALRRIGEFVGIAQILFYQVEPDGMSLTCRNEWIDPAFGLPSRVGGKLTIDSALQKFVQRKSDEPFSLSSNLPGMKAAMAPYRLNFTSFIATSIPVNGRVYGVLDFSREDDGRDWTESEFSLATLAASLLSGIIDRHEMEEQLRMLSSIVERSPLCTLYIAADGKVSYVNPAAEAISGYTAAELIEGGLGLLFDEATRLRFEREYLPQAIAHGTSHCEIGLISKDGRRRTMAFSNFTMSEGSANIGCIASDVTEIRALEAELIAAKELAEQGSRSKSEFLSRMSHEMRTPMNAIIGMTSIAQSSRDPEKKEYCLDQIHNASRHLLGVINDILDMSKIEADKFELTYTDFSFERMLANVVNVVRFNLEEKHQNLTISVDPAIPTFITGDEQRLAQVVTNLLTNAAKFTPDQGAIQLDATLCDVHDGTYVIRVAITDNGIGISKAQQVKLFRSFEQADGSIARKFGGTGLGLAISKRIVELMGGEIGVESELNQGSCFRFTFRAAAGHGEVQADAQEADDRAALPEGQAFAGKTALLAEDVEINREIILTVLEGTGIAIDCAENGALAVEMFMRDPKRYDIILMDIHMPEVDGLEATRRIRAHTAPESAKVPIVAMTANVFQEDVERCLRAGMNDHIGKPIDFDELKRKLKQHLSG